MALLDQTKDNGGSLTAIKKILRKINLNTLKANHKDTNTVETDHMSYVELDERAAQMQQMSLAASYYAMDDVLGLRNLHINEPSGNNSYCVKCAPYEG